jgi:hypothetical protein
MNTLTERAKLRSLQDAKETLENEIGGLANEVFPIGALVRFSKGNGDIEARITMHSSGRSFRICNIKTGKEYWVGLYDLLEERS